MPDSCYLAKYVSYLWPTVAADRTRRLSLQDTPCWLCNTPQAAELLLLLSGDTISGATRKAVGEYMVRHSFFEENELRLAEARLLSLAQPPWQRRNVSPANWHEDVYADYRDIVLLFAFVLRDPRCDPARLVWGPENEPFKAPGDGGYVADACNGSWYGGGRRWGPGAREAARLCRSGGGGRRRRARDEYLANNMLHLAK